MNGRSVDTRIALYWDFENIDASIGGRKPHVDLGAIVRYCATLGTITINRAYANWVRHTSYANALQEHAVDLVQLFPISGTKNGADIRLAIDAVGDAYVGAGVDTAVIVTGDADFISLGLRLRALGVRVVGVGARGSVNKRWVAACDEFKYYETLVAKGSVGKKQARRPQASQTELVAARELLEGCLRERIEDNDGQPVPQGSVYSLMKRLRPDFDQANLGFRTFSAFVDGVGTQVVERLDNESGGDPLIRLRSGPTPIANGQLRAAEDEPYKHELRVLGVTVPRPQVVLLGGAWLEGSAFRGNAEAVDSSLENFATTKSVAATPAELKHLRTLLAGSRSLATSGGEYRVVENAARRGSLAIFEGMADLLLRRVSGELDVRALARCLYGTEADAPFGLAPFERLGSLEHRASVALRRAGLLSVGSDLLHGLSDWAARSDLLKGFASDAELEIHLSKFFDVESDTAARCRLILHRTGVVRAEPDGAVIVSSPSDVAYYAGISRLVAGAQEMADVEPADAAAAVRSLLGDAVPQGTWEASVLDVESQTGSASERSSLGTIPHGPYDLRGRSLDGEVAAVARALKKVGFVVDHPPALLALIEPDTRFPGGSRQDFNELVTTVVRESVEDPSGLAKRIYSVLHRAGQLRSGPDGDIVAHWDENPLEALMSAAAQRTLSVAGESPSAEALSAYFGVHVTATALAERVLSDLLAAKSG